MAPTAEYRLHPVLPKVWARVAAFVVAGPAIGGAIVAVVFEQFWLLPVIALAACLLPLLAGRYGRRYVATFRLLLLPGGLAIRRGVWWRSDAFVPRGRVQHTDVGQGPLARRLGIATLKVFTAGSTHSELEVDGLRHADAIELRDRLLEPHGTDA
jgi:membrane protein YdbS with pleckstrin-like domain